MKNFTKFLAIVVVGLAFSATTFGQDTESATATAVIVQPINLTNNANMNFGSIAATAAGGTVQITAANPTVRSAVGVTLVSGGGEAAAQFTVTGAANSGYTIQLPGNGVVTIDDAGAGVAMPVNGFVNSAVSGNLGAGGSQSFFVGATLTVGASQLAGTYSGTFNVTVNYN